MASGKKFSFLIYVLLIKNISSQIHIPINGCGCQTIPVQQNLPFQIANCGRNGLLANLPNGLQLANSLLAKTVLGNPCQPCQPCQNVVTGLSNNLQLANLQNFQLANINNLQSNAACGNAIPQDLLGSNGMPLNCQNALQFSLQALLNQLQQQQLCQCGCQAAQSSGINANLNLLASGVQNSIANLPCQGLQMMNVQGVQQDVVINNSPCQNVVTNPCPCQACQNVVANPCPCQSCQNVVTNPCPCQACQNVVTNSCPCQVSQNPVQFTIYH